MEMYKWSLEKNVGNTDRALRSAFASAMISYAFTKNVSTTGKIVLMLGAGMLLATSITGKCPGYQALGVDTRDYNKA